MERPPAGVIRVIRAIDTFGDWCGKVWAWLIIPLIGGLCYEVIARYVFDRPTIWAYDLGYMLYGGHFMLGAGYTLLKKGHIRTDFFYESWSPRRQGTVDAVCYLFLFFPGLLLFLAASWDNAWASFVIGESSEASPWRPILWPFKMCMPIGAIFLIVQGVSEFLKSVIAARTGRWP